jgi:FkbM family methyltransferase
MQVFLSGLRQGLSALTIKLIENIQNLAKDSSFSSDVQAGRHFYAGNNTIFATLCTGQIIAVDRRDLSLAPHLILKGYWERELSLRCEHLVKTLQAPVIFDVGCNFGWYGLILSRFSPYSQIHFFEANPALIELLQKTTIANGFSLRSKIINRAVSSRSGKFLELSVPALHKGSSSVSGFNHDLERFHENMLTIEKVSVESITLDDYCKEHSVDSIHFLKIDVEGSEADVILGAQMIIRRSPSLFILME